MKTHLFFGTLTVVLLVIVISSRHKETFSYEAVVAMAEEMAREGYLSAAPTLPEELRALNYDQLRDIRWRDELTLWRQQGLPFQARFFHPGGIHDRPVTIYEVTGDRAEPIRYSSDFFQFGKNTLDLPLPDSVGYAGFRIHHPLNSPEVLDEVLVFLGSNYFRALAKGQHYGISARGLAIDTALPKQKEEFPVFTKFWLRRPDAFAGQMTLYALLESRSVIGAYQFDVRPGDETQIDVTATLFFTRVPEVVGYAPLTSMFWFGENTSNTFGDFRPEVHDSDGLLMVRSNGEWVWHPLTWARQLQHNVFTDANPGGFGLFQRDRDFNHYLDLEAHYHKRPSVWVTPREGFDEGAVHLIQIPTSNEFMDNVVAFWSPVRPPVPLGNVKLRYTLRWLNDAPDLPSLGRVISTRIDDQDKAYYRHVILEFTGGPLTELRPGEIPEVDVTAVTPGASYSDVRIEWNGFNNSWRVSFFVSTPENQRPNEFTCRLKWQGRILTETWSYTWVP